MGFSAGTLDLSILGKSNEAIESIDKTVKSLNSLSRAITKIYNLPVLGSSNTLAMFFEKVSEATSKIDTTKINNLATSAKALSSVSSLTKLDKVNWDNVASGFNNLTTSITPFLNKVKEAEASLNALYGILNKSSGGKINSLINNSGTGSSKNSGGLAGLLKFGKLSVILHIARRIGNVLGDIVSKGSDFGETLNLWQTSMGDKFLPQATEFVNKLNQAYGISKQTLMNSQAIFKNMLGSLGQISDETAYQLSEGITQMALDYASLYNVNFDTAMTKFQAALAGQVRPIRSVSGYDITENTIYQLYQELGGTKSMRQLNRTEKQLLSIYAVFEQMERSGATGDLKKTIESFANQSRVMAESWDEVKTYAGLIVTRNLQQWGIMQKINAVLIAAGRVLEQIANSIEDEYSVPQDVFGDINQSAENATESVEELKKALLDFDKFRSLDNDTTGGGALGLDSTLVKAIDKYNSILSNVNMEATKLADDWTEKLEGIINSNLVGFVKDVFDLLVKIGKVLGNSEYGILYWIQSIVEEIDNEVFGAFRDIWKWFTDNILTDEAIASFGELLQWLKDWNEELSNTKDPFEKIRIGLQKLVDLFDELGLTQMWKDIVDSASANWQDILKILEFIGRANMQQSNMPMFADGGLPDKGTVFVAGEAGAEMVYNMPSGQSGVANVQQIAQATYQGTMSALRDWWGGQNAKGDIPHLQEANPTGLYEAVTGVAGSYGNTWSQI